MKNKIKILQEFIEERKPTGIIGVTGYQGNRIAFDLYEQAGEI